MPFTVFASTSGSAVSGVSRRASASSRDAGASAQLQNVARYQPIIADAADSAFESATGIAAIFLRDTCLGAAVGCAPQVIRISVGWNGAEPNGASSSPSVTATGRFVVGVQWHPERGWREDPASQALFSALIEQAHLRYNGAK